MNDYSVDGSVIAYQVDANSMPILSTGRVLVSGMQNPAGITLDPQTGDILIDSYTGNQWDVLHAGPEPGTWVLLLGGLTAFASAGVLRRRRC